VEKWVKRIAAVLLLPVCLGAAKTLILVVRTLGDADTFWVAALSGAACWLMIYLTLPKPMLVYVLGHELTHAIWTWAFGGKVRRFKARASGGFVMVTRNNFLIALAPYFFPLYAVMVIAAFALGHWLCGWKQHLVWFHLLVGAAYAFHVTLTSYILGIRQSDITQQGYLFSAVVIWLGNVLVLLIGLPLLTSKVDLLTTFGWIWQSTFEVLEQARRVFW